MVRTDMTYEEYLEEQRKKATEKRRRMARNVGGVLKSLGSPQKTAFESQQAQQR